jgi:uncharacterized protein (TIGR03435 family)
MPILRIVLALLLLTPAAAFPQAFEAASIVVNKSRGNQGGVRADPAILTATNATMKQLILYAYQVAGPDWLDSERYDVRGKAEGTASTDQMRLMLRGLLAERFRLQAHRETKEMPVYWLVVAKNGPKLHDVKEADALMQNGSPPALRPGVNGMFIRARLSDLADVLARPLGRPVLDKTGIDGWYFFQLEWALDPPPGAGAVTAEPRATIPETDPSLFTALEDKFGLRLESRRSAIEVLVIDQVERTPAEN